MEHHHRQVPSSLRRLAVMTPMAPELEPVSRIHLCQFCAGILPDPFKQIVQLIYHRVDWSPSIDRFLSYGVQVIPSVVQNLANVVRHRLFTSSDLMYYIIYLLIFSHADVSLSFCLFCLAPQSLTYFSK